MIHELKKYINQVISHYEAIASAGNLQGYERNHLDVYKSIRDKIVEMEANACSEKQAIPIDRKLLLDLVDITWGRAYGDVSVPSTKLANELIDKAISENTGVNFQAPALWKVWHMHSKESPCFYDNQEDVKKHMGLSALYKVQEYYTK